MPSKTVLFFQSIDYSENTNLIKAPSAIYLCFFSLRLCHFAPLREIFYSVIAYK
jgi:hypothetical protein